MRVDGCCDTYDIDVLNRSDLTKTSQCVKEELPKYWDKEYIRQAINRIENPSHGMLIKFLWMSGVRITEAISLTKGSIDFQNYTVKLKWLKSRKYHYRIAPLHPVLRDILHVYTAAMKLEDKIFPISRQRAWQLAQIYLKGHPHQLRHSFAVNWLRCGGDIVVLHKILGHSKIQTTMKYLMIVPIDQGKELIKINF